MNDRERFEDTFSLIHSTASKELLFETRKDGRYASLVTNSAYEMWKAATADSAARITELEKDAARYRWILDNPELAENLLANLAPFYWSSEIDRIINETKT
jgi:hypothetical protein